MRIGSVMPNSAKTASAFSIISWRSPGPASRGPEIVTSGFTPSR